MTLQMINYFGNKLEKLLLLILFICCYFQLGVDIRQNNMLFISHTLVSVSLPRVGYLKGNKRYQTSTKTLRFIPVIGSLLFERVFYI